MPTYVRQQNLTSKTISKSTDKHNKISTIPTNNRLAKTTNIQTKNTSKKHLFKIKNSTEQELQIA